ncbi:MAG: hypothetical protein KDA16_13165 [Phycisphaerales bacterium]|nr:hypothetical protein [Phycisphaerales bacterium]
MSESIKGVLSGLERLKEAREKDIRRLFDSDTRFQTAAMLVLDDLYETMSMRMCNYDHMTFNGGERQDSVDFIERFKSDIEDAGRRLFGFEWMPAIARRASKSPAPTAGGGRE